MGFIIGLLTFIMVLDCLLLIFLILMQLPKKEAGMGTAFGGGATDALFGPGSGNVLTKTTKYAAGIFLILSLLLSVLGSHRATSKTQNIKQKLEQKAGSAPQLPVPGTPTSQITPVPAAVPAAAPATNIVTIKPTNAAPAAPAPATATPAPTPAPAATNKPAAAAPTPPTAPVAPANPAPKK